MSSDATSPVQRKPTDLLEHFREYLMLLARVHLGDQYRGKIDASDVVQIAMLEAHRNHDQFRGQSQQEMAGWLRRILATSIADATKGMTRAKRDLHREKSLQDALDRSAAKLETFLAADESSPSQKALRQEQVLMMAEAMAKLPVSQRDAILMRYCQGLTMADIGKRLGCSAPAVVGFLQRGLEQLRNVLRDAE